MKLSNTSVADSMRQEAEKFTPNNLSKASIDISKGEALHQIKKMELRIAELELQNEELATNNVKNKSITQQYSNFFNQAPTAYLIISKSGRIKNINTEASILLKKELSQLKNSNLGTFLSPDQNIKFLNFLQTIFKNKKKETTELSIQTDIPSIITITGILIDNTKHCLVQMTDNTDFRSEFELLQRERGFIQDILNTQPAGIYQLRVPPLKKCKKDSWQNSQHPPYIMEFLNDRLCNILGVKREMLEKHPNIISELIHPEDKIGFIKLNEDANQKITLFEWAGRIIVNNKIKWIHLESIPRVIENGEILWTGLLYDNTESKRLEANLKLSEIKFENMFNHSIVGKSLTTLNGELNTNLAFEKIIGYSKKELQNTFWEDITFPEDIQQNKEKQDQIISGKKKSVRWEKRLIHKNGSLIWADLSTTLLRDDNQKPLFYITEIIDITERKQAQFALQKSNERLNLILENCPIAIWDWDLKTDKWFATQKYYTMLGYEPENNYPDRDLWLSRVHPEDRERVQLNIEKIFQLKDEAYGYDVRMLHADGTYRWHSVMGQVIERTESGKTKRMLGVLVDINERKLIEEKLRKSEEKLRTLFSSMTEMVVIHELVFNKNGDAINYVIIDCNHAFTNITGIERQNAVGKLATEVYGTDSAPYLEQYAHVAISGETLKFDSYFAPMDKHFLISVITHKKNKFATITTDVTVLKHVQRQISAKNKELEDYLYIASHDLRSPLVNIQGFSQRLQKLTDNIKLLLTNSNLDTTVKRSIDKITTEDIPKTLNFVFSSVVKIEALINGLLQLLRTSTIKINVDKVDMNKLINTVLDTHNFQISELSANVNIENLPECYGDEQQLNQLFANVINNAIKYRVENTQLEIKISAINTLNRVIYYITDNGTGIAPKYLDKIWSIFYRINPQSTTLGEGVGLSVVKLIADRHHGRVWVESEVGKGSTFFIELQKNIFLV